MIHNVFTIYDQAADAYLPPFILPKTDMAKRTFEQCINSEEHQFAQNPEDYTLFVLGTFNDEDAVFQPLPAKQSIGNGVEFVKPDYADNLTELQNHEPSNSSIKQKPNGAQLQSSTAGEDST